MWQTVSAESYLNCEAPSQEVSEGEQYCNLDGNQVLSCVPLVKKNVAAFCLSPKKLPGTNLRSNGLISSVEEISL